MRKILEILLLRLWPLVFTLWHASGTLLIQIQILWRKALQN